MKEVDATEETGTKRQRAEMPAPAYNLADSIAVANAVHDKGGGTATADQLAAFLDYKGTNNGAFITRVAAAKHYKLIDGGGRGGTYRITPLAERILMPVYPESAHEALLDAFFNVPLFKAVYDEYKGKELPSEFGFKNMLRTRFGITPARLAAAYRILMESADQAGLFKTRGAKTQLIMPQITRSAAPAQVTKEENGDGGRGGDGQGSGGARPPAPQTQDDLRGAYVSTLIEMLREKGKKGESDPDLMERIEKLLAMT